MESVGERIRQAREAKGWTQDQLGAALKTSRTLVSAWERDETIPRGSTRLKIAGVLGVATEWLRTGDGPVGRETPSIPDPETDAVIERMRWMYAQPDLKALLEMSPIKVDALRAERGSAMVDAKHRDHLEWRIFKILKERGQDLSEAKKEAVLKAAWAEGGGWGTSPEDDQIQRYIDIALA